MKEKTLLTVFFPSPLSRCLRVSPHCAIGILAVVAGLFMLPPTAIGGMTLGAEVVHGAETSGVNTLTYNGWKAGRGPVCPVISHNEASERLIVSPSRMSLT
jgi:hypothetical protein